MNETETLERIAQALEAIATAMQVQEAKTYTWTPEGLPLCPKHGAVMKKREKQKLAGWMVVAVLALAASSVPAEPSRRLAADFVMERTIEALSDTVRSSGRLFLGGPGLLRWETAEPSRSILVVNGGRGLRSLSVCPALPTQNDAPRSKPTTFSACSRAVKRTSASFSRCSCASN